MTEEAAGREPLPVFTTFEECIAYCREKQDSFYATAFLLEKWVRVLISKTYSQYGERKGSRWRLQTGTGWEVWQSMFSYAKPEKWGDMLQCLVRFSNYDTPEAEMVEQVFSIASDEDEYAQGASGSAFAARVTNGEVDFPELVERTRDIFRRTAEWMDAVVHWHVHLTAATVPGILQGTEEKRALFEIGLVQAGYAGLNERGRALWRYAHDEMAKQFHGKPDWRLVGRAQSLEKFGEMRRPVVDELTIHWWPLLTRYRWTDRDLRGLLRRVVRHPDAYPLREDKEFADYRKKILGLSKGKEDRDKSAPDGQPTGWRVAMAMTGKLSE